MTRATMLASACLVLWLFEIIPLYVTTLALWAGMIVLLQPLDSVTFSPARVVSSATHPIMVLFLGGFVLSIAAGKYGIETFLADWMIRLSGGSRRLLLLAVMGIAAVFSMWMLNTAASAILLSTVRPLLSRSGHDKPFSAALLLALAFGANLGGMSTPIGSGPNGIAIAAVSARSPITFVRWMLIALPFVLALCVLLYGVLVVRFRVRGRIEKVPITSPELPKGALWVVLIFLAMVITWITEPLHHLPASAVAIVAMAVLFGSGLLNTSDLGKIGWDTLLMIAGGLTLGQLFVDSGLSATMAGSISWHELNPRWTLLGFIVVCALISAVSSNTAATAMLVQIAMSVAPSASTAVMIALGSSMGMPFVISTPSNTLVYGEGVLQPKDLLWPGLIVMVVGCLSLAFMGPPLLRWIGIP